MVWQWVVAVGVLGAAAKVLGSSDLDHDQTVQRAYDTLQSAVPPSATVYADHISDGPNPRGEVDGLEYVPDLVVKAGAASNLLIEVETQASLDNSRASARRQVRDFRKRGYKRVLVVPPGEEDVEAVREFIDEFEDLDGNLYLSDPDSVDELL